MVSKRIRRNGNGGIEQQNENDEGGAAEYEQSREERIKDNLQRMNKLGILDLSRNLKPPSKSKRGRPKGSRTSRPSSVPRPSGSPRRSSRIKILPTVSYFKKCVVKEKVVKNVQIIIKEGSQPEVYTEEHEKMLGDYKETWELMVDGYDDEGNRNYDAYNTKNCHQCRQKTIGLRTKCCKCRSAQGQFCGDCLFMRYGENIEEANANPDWICPVCRDICNCNRCRKVKGWEPTGDLFGKALQLGYKSVAHYLIQTRAKHGKHEKIDNKTACSPTDEKGEQLDEKDCDNNQMDEDIKHPHVHDLHPKGEADDVDQDYKFDHHGDDGDNDDDDDDEDSSSEDD